MRPTATLLLIAALASTATAADEPKGDLAKLQGSWTGKVGPEGNIPVTMTLKGNAIELKGMTPDGDEFTIKGELKLDEKAKLKTIDYLKFTLPDGNELPDSLGLYKIEGDNLIVCSGGPGGDRPTEFKAGDQGPPMLTTWTRVKEKGEKKPAEAEKPKMADEPKGDLAKLQGSWAAKIGQAPKIEVVLTLKGSDVDLNGKLPNGQEFSLKGQFKLDEKASPKTIDWVKFAGPETGEIPDNLGIYRFDGDRLTICAGGPGNDRPTEFKAGDEGPPNLETWTRVPAKAKPDSEKPKLADLDKFQGVWLAKTGPDQSWTVEMEIKGGAVSSRWPTSADTDVVFKGDLKLNDKKSPKNVDFLHFKSGDGDALRDNPGIYAFEGETIKIAIGGPDGERPTDFKPGEGQYPMILVFKKK